MRGQLTSGDPFRCFDLIYCINLDSRPDRWQEAVREFSALNIVDRVERVPAIAHANPREGCRLSHLECVRRADAAGAETVLIFEDDVIFRAYSHERFARYLARLRTIPDWELFYLGGTVLANPERYGELMRVPMAGAQAYAVHRRAFAKIRNATVPYDNWLARNMTSYCADPMLAWQRDGFSNLEGKWIAPQRLETEYYLRFVARPKAKKIARDILRQEMPWRLRFIRLRLRLKRSVGSIVSALGIHGVIRARADTSEFSLPESGRKK
jgi:glycosyl transferase family 25